MLSHEICGVLSFGRRWRILHIIQQQPLTIDLVCAALGVEAAINSAARQAVRRDLGALVEAGLIQRVPDENPLVYRFNREAFDLMIACFQKVVE